MAIPDGVMLFDIAKSPGNIYLHTRELKDLLLWLNTNRHRFIEDVLKGDYSQ